MDTSLTSTVDTTLSSYNDFASLGRLKGAAAQDPNQALRATAEQFEAHFIQQMLQVMRQTIDKGELTTSDSLEMYEGMFDKEVALQMTKRGGIGLADMLEKHMTSAVSAPADLLPASQALQLRAAPAQIVPIGEAKAPSLALPEPSGSRALPVTPLNNPSAIDLNTDGSDGL